MASLELSGGQQLAKGGLGEELPVVEVCLRLPFSGGEDRRGGRDWGEGVIFPPASFSGPRAVDGEVCAGAEERAPSKRDEDGERGFAWIWAAFSISSTECTEPALASGSCSVAFTVASSNRLRSAAAVFSFNCWRSSSDKLRMDIFTS